MSANEKYITRFAPSPTGYLHMGHILSAVYVWSIARYFQAKIILRIEDHDRSRCKKIYEQAILDDLDWLGLAADLGVENVDAASPYRQSDDHLPYIKALDVLTDKNLIYACQCSRREIHQRTSPQQAIAEEELVYDHFCRDKAIAFSAHYGRRFVLADKNIEFYDGILAKQMQNPYRQCGDFLLRHAEGEWTYQFAVVVDDLKHGVNLVIRGEDLLSSTARQIALGAALGRVKPIKFCHHPLIRDQGGQKLAKRIFSTAIAKLRADGSCVSDLLQQMWQFIGSESLLPAHAIWQSKPANINELTELFCQNIKFIAPHLISDNSA